MGRTRGELISLHGRIFRLHMHVGHAACSMGHAACGCLSRVAHKCGSRLDSTRLDSTRLCPKLCANVYGLSTCGMGHMQLVATLPACCLLAAYFVCLNAGSVAGHSRLWQEAHGRASNVATGNCPKWLQATNVVSMSTHTHICALCSASVLQLGLELHLPLPCGSCRWSCCTCHWD